VHRNLPSPQGFFHHPANFFNNFNNELSEIFDELTRGFHPLKSKFFRNFYEIKVDVYEQDNEMVVSAEMPGVNKEDLDIRVYPQQVSIKANKKQAEEISEDSYYHSEVYRGTISRTIPLPVEVDPQNCRAEFKNGVLEIRMAKIKPENPGKQIKID